MRSDLSRRALIAIHLFTTPFARSSGRVVRFRDLTQPTQKQAGSVTWLAYAYGRRRRSSWTTAYAAVTKMSLPACCRMALWQTREIQAFENIAVEDNLVEPECIQGRDHCFSPRRIGAQVQV